jgi:hypothetical protein
MTKQLKKDKGPLNNMTDATETEIETDKDFAATLAKQKEEMEKTKAKGSATEKKAGNVTKRIIVAIFIFGWYLIPI